MVLTVLHCRSKGKEHTRYGSYSMGDMDVKETDSLHTHG